MTNLAYRQPQKQENGIYVDFAAHAARRKAQQEKKYLCVQRRYGLYLLLLCVVLAVISLGTAVADLTAVLVFAPLGLYLLTTKQVLLYRPNTTR